MQFLKLTTLIWMSLWLLVVMPGHKRGIVRMPFSNTAATCCSVPIESVSCCSPTQAPGANQDTNQTTTQGCPHPSSSSASTSQAPPTDPAKDCALCYLRGVMELPAEVAFDPPPFRFAFEFHLPTYRVAVYSLPTPQAAFARPPPVI